MDADVIVIGAGLSGLACALSLRERSLEPLVLDAADAADGRIRTDQQEGFLRDRGFQVLQTWYPEARRLLDYDALDLRPFEPGALDRFRGDFHRVSDVWRRPGRLLEMIRSPVATTADKLRLLALRRRALRGGLDELYGRPETDALRLLRDLGFSPLSIDRFFKPFFAGVFFEPDLAVSSRAFEFVFRAFALGDTALPARGMGAIPAQLAAKLPSEAIRLQARVRQLQDGQVVLETGERLRARALVVATGAREAARLLEWKTLPETRGTTCFYFAGRHLVTVNLFGTEADPDRIEADLRRELAAWFGAAVKHWERLAVYRLPEALPRQAPPVADPGARELRVDKRLWCCAELGGAPSIHWALHSGSRAGAEVAVALSGRPREASRPHEDC